jgi:hypothetical protein
MFLGQDATRKYELNQFRRSNLIRMRKYMNEQLIDQIPALASLQRSLDELRISNTENIATSNPFIVEAISTIRVSIMYGKNWKSIAQY